MSRYFFMQSTFVLFSRNGTRFTARRCHEAPYVKIEEGVLQKEISGHGGQLGFTVLPSSPADPSLLTHCFIIASIGSDIRDFHAEIRYYCMSIMDELVKKDYERSTWLRGMIILKCI